MNHTIQAVETLAQDYEECIQRYHKHLEQALTNYAGGFQDPLHGKLEGFGQEIQTGDSEQTRQMKLAAFGSIVVTAGIHYDPDPLRDLEELQKLVDSYQKTIETARDAKSLTATIAWGDPEPISTKDYRDLTRRLRTAEQHAEAARARARKTFPIHLTLGETAVVGQGVDGPNATAEFLGIRLGRPLGNVSSQLRLTYSGKSAQGDVFLETLLQSRAGKTRTDTVVRSRAILMYSDPGDPVRYGYAVTSHKYGGYRVIGARVADVAENVQDWIWKSLSRPDAALPTPSELQQAISLRPSTADASASEAIDALWELANRSVQQNDKILIAEAKATHQRVPLPEQGLKVYFPQARARLYLGRALASGDPRFLEAQRAVSFALGKARFSVQPRLGSLQLLQRRSGLVSPTAMERDRPAGTDLHGGCSRSRFRRRAIQ